MGSLLLFFVFIGGVCLCWEITCRGYNANLKKGILYENSNMIYRGGIPSIVGGCKVQLVLKQDEFVLNRGSIALKKINFKDISNVEIMSEQQIMQQVSLGNILVFGLMALGMKKGKTVYDNSIVLTYGEDKEVKKLILGTNYSLEMVVRILRARIGIK